MRMFCKSLAVGVLLLVVSLHCCAESSAPSSVKQEAKPVSVVNGRVIDQNGKPVAKAKVLALTHKRSSSEPDTKTLYTDKNGDFVFNPSQDVTYYSFAATAAGYSSGSSYWNKNGNNKVEIKLWPGYKLKGKIVDENGKSLKGIKVAVSYCNGSTGNGSGYANLQNMGGMLEATTGNDGAFTIQHLINPDDFQYYNMGLQISGEGRASFTTYIDKSKLSDIVSITDPPSCTVEGTLYLPDKSGTAPEGTGVTVMLPQAYMGQTRGCCVDKNGKFKIDAIPPGKVTVVLTPPYYTRGPKGEIIPPPLPQWAMPAVDVELTPDKPANLNLMFTKGAVVKGVVTNKKTGAPIPNAELMIEHPGSLPTYWANRCSTDDKGRFEARVAAGKVKVAIQRFDDTYFQPDEAPNVSFTISDGDEKTDVALAVSPTENNNGMYQAVNKPVTDGFELKPGTYDLTWDPELNCSNAVYLRPMRSADEVTKLIKNAPKFVSSKVVYNAYTFDGGDNAGKLAVVLDESKGTGKGYDTAYIDANRNWDLTDDEPIHFSPVTQNSILTDWVKVQSHQGTADQRTDNYFQVRLRIYGNSGGSPYIQAERNGGWKGTIDTTSGPVECALIDSNGNGIYGEAAKFKADGSPEAGGDNFFVDDNEAGQVIACGWGSHEIMINPVSKVGDKYYYITSNAIGDKVSVKPYIGELGALSIRPVNVQGMNGKATGFYVSSQSGSYFCSDSGNKPAMLPVGSYKVSYCSLNLKSKNSKTLNMQCSLDKNIEIKSESKKTLYLLGGLTLAFNQDQKDIVWKPGASERITWLIKIGSMGSLSSIGDRNSNAAPKVKFFDKAGNLLSTTTAGYT